MPEQPSTNAHRDDQSSGRAIGLVAMSLAGTDVVAEVLAVGLGHLGHRWHNLATVFGWLVFDWALLLDVAAVLLAILALIVGRRSREARLRALLALALVA